MQKQKPTASLSLDLDNQWSYMKTHGDAGWESFPSYLNIVVPRVLKFLQERELTITFFIVGQDAALDQNAEALRSLSAAGHDIGNHSFHHEPWLHLYSEAKIEAEIAKAEEEIERVTGCRPRGFRGPGFSLSEAVLRVLARRGYDYDASTFPTFLGPLARAYYFMTAKLSKAEMAQRKALFGTMSEGLRPLKPYCWSLSEQQKLIEIPVTTLPIFKVPLHVSYLLYLSSFSPALASRYFKTAIRMCRMSWVRCRCTGGVVMAIPSYRSTDGRKNLDGSDVSRPLRSRDEPARPVLPQAHRHDASHDPEARSRDLGDRSGERREAYRRALVGGTIPFIRR